MVVSCVVELAMTLPMAVYFHRITLFALPVNMFILPLLVVLMPAALLTLVLLFWPAAAVVPAMVVALVLHFGVGLVHLLARWRPGDFRIPAPAAWQSASILRAAGAAIVLAVLERWQHEDVGSAGSPGLALLLAAAGRGRCRARSSIRAMRCWLRPSTWGRATRCC